MNDSYHLDHFPPVPKLWPHGGWSVYRITGDDIARRVGFDADGKVIRRDGWPGYLGSFRTLLDVVRAIDEAGPSSG